MKIMDKMFLFLLFTFSVAVWWLLAVATLGLLGYLR